MPSDEVSRVNVTDAGLESLKGLTQLRFLQQWASGDCLDDYDPGREPPRASLLP